MFSLYNVITVILDLQIETYKSHPDNITENVEALFSLQTVLKINVRVDGNS